ncbi:MAG: hypothetical protein H6739_10650 [Alphaproteobacteria bacterium]|nr:hypothetical protein [Alphaproteobacteria bacterium]
MSPKPPTLIFRPRAPRNPDPLASPAEAPALGGLLRWLTEPRPEVHIDPVERTVAVAGRRLLGASHIRARYFVPELAAVVVAWHHPVDERGRAALRMVVYLQPTEEDDPPIDLETDLEVAAALDLATQVAELLGLPMRCPPGLAEAS